MPHLSIAAAERNHCATHRELLIRFALWASGLQEVPAWERISMHFQVSRATAYRWRRDWCDAMGIDPPPFQRSRALTRAEVLRIRKETVGLIAARSAEEACRTCEFFSQLHPCSRWGRCRKHTFAVRPSHSCSQHTSRE